MVLASSSSEMKRCSTIIISLHYWNLLMLYLYKNNLKLFDSDIVINKDVSEVMNAFLNEKLLLLI